jgi:protein O-GlcNAc transferase
MKKRVISFALWGEFRLYCIGAIKNALLAKKIFPGWICRYYYDVTVPKIIIDYLKNLDNTELIYIEEKSGAIKYKENGQFGMFWKFFPFNDDDVEIWLSRDVDSRISPYEKRILDEFLKSDNIIHSFRNSNEGPLRGGMTSFKNFNGDKDNRIINNKKLDIFELTAYIDRYNTPFYSDEKFLNNIILPYYKNNYDSAPRSPSDSITNHIEIPIYCGDYCGRVLDEYDEFIDKYGGQCDYGKNYDDLYKLLDEYKNII